MYETPTPTPAPAAAKKKHTPLIVLVGVFAVLALCIGGSVIAAVSTDSADKSATVAPAATDTAGHAATTAGRPGRPEVYERIAAETDCAKLQSDFDNAEANHKMDLNRGRPDLAEIDTSYMDAADNRMAEVGCYK